MVYKPNVAIIGSGVSGLLSLKNCLEVGLSPIVYEASPTPLGLWNPSEGNVYENLYSNISIYSQQFHDHPWDLSTQIYPTNKEIIDYLYKYIDRYKMFQYINFKSNVIKIKRNEKDTKWELTIRDHSGFKMQEIDKVIISSGALNKPLIPKFRGHFKGRIIHSRNYRSNKEFENRRVCVIGMGSSGSEVAFNVSKTASRTIVSIRNPPYLTRRLVQHPQTEKIIQFDFVYLQRKKDNYFDHYIDSSNVHKIRGYTSQLFLKFGKNNEGLSNLQPNKNSSSFSLSGEVLDEIKNGSIEIKTGFRSFTENGVLFDDGSFEEVDDVIFCTGYKTSVDDFLHEDVLKKLNFSDSKNYPMVLYKGVFHRNVKQMCFVGIFQGLFWIGLDLQARYAAYLLGGIIDYPEKEKFESIMYKEKIMKNTKPSPFRPFPLIAYCDSLSYEFGSRPNLAEYKIKNNELYQILMNIPINCHHYRLEGPYSTRENSIKMLMNIKNKIYPDIFPNFTV